jgi:hypothetical protein
MNRSEHKRRKREAFYTAKSQGIGIGIGLSISRPTTDEGNLAPKARSVLSALLVAPSLQSTCRRSRWSSEAVAVRVCCDVRPFQRPHCARSNEGKLDRMRRIRVSSVDRTGARH